MAKKTKFPSESDFDKHIRQKALIAHDIPEHFHKKRVFQDASAGAGNAGYPIKLNSSGDIDKTMLPPIVLKDNAEADRKFFVSDVAPGAGDGEDGDLWFEF